VSSVPKIPLEVRADIEDLLFHEAALLESDKYTEWLDLLTDDIKYVMPVREAVEIPKGATISATPSFALFDDDKSSLTLRVQRILSGLAHAEAPPSVTQRLITNIRGQVSDEPNHFSVWSSFLVHQVRRGRAEYTFIGQREDQIRRVGEDLKFSHRTINLTHSILPSTISIFL